jgi:hypothetical protein
MNLKAAEKLILRKSCLFDFIPSVLKSYMISKRLRIRHPKYLVFSASRASFSSACVNHKLLNNKNNIS